MENEPLKSDYYNLLCCVLPLLACLEGNINLIYFLMGDFHLMMAILWLIWIWLCTWGSKGLVQIHFSAKLQMNKLLSQRCQPMKCAQFITTHNKVADPDLELYTQYGVPFKNKSAKKKILSEKVLGLNLGEDPLLDCHFIVIQCILLSCMWHFTALSYCYV